MSKHRKRYKKQDRYEYLELDPDKFVIVKEDDGQYAIYYNDATVPLMIKRVVSDDDEYAYNYIVEILGFLQMTI